VGRRQLEGPHRLVCHTDWLSLSLAGVRYRDEIVHAIVRRNAGTTGPDFIPMDDIDNARPHRARVVQQYLQAETNDRMHWPGRSPDLSPTEHAWDSAGCSFSSSCTIKSVYKISEMH